MSEEVVARLRRRVERERAARLEAEAIAERSTRELYDRHQELLLLEGIAGAANGTDLTEELLALTLERVCRHLSWPAGQVWLVDDSAESLVLAPVAYAEDAARFAPLRAASEAMTLRAGQGLPGRVLRSGAPAWIEEVGRDPNFPRASAAEQAGVVSAIGVPIAMAERVFAVMELFTGAAPEPSPELIRVLAQVGVQVGRVFRRAEAARDLRHQATHDALTGLPNRTLFADRVGQALALAQRHSRVIAVALLDVDRFKEINDTLGHLQGDRLLVEVGTRLSQTLRESDTIARLGGDEFGLVLPEVADRAAALQAAARLQQALRAPFIADEVHVDVDASIGIALFPSHGADSETLIRHADVAMYEAKRRHLGAAVYDQALDPHSSDRLGMVAALRRAIEHGELVVHYQPKVTVSDPESVSGVEALVRWSHPQRGLVAPSEFIPVAEQTGLIRPLTSLVLDLALNQARRWLDQGMAIPVAVNVAARSLLDDSFPEEVCAKIARAGVPPTLLALEVTESAMLEDPERSLSLLGRLAQSGISVAIDDFGTGYSSMAQLKRLPLTELKIDRGFTLSMLADERDAFIVRATIQLGHNLGLRIIAEGVEDEATLARLHELGCDLAQGYLIARPAAAEELTEWLALRGGTVAHPPPA